MIFRYWFAKLDNYRIFYLKLEMIILLYLLNYEYHEITFMIHIYIQINTF